MDRRALYDEDYFAWLQQQADALRRLAQSRRDLPNDLDVEQIAEEIEDVGKSELRATRSFVRNILMHLILIAFDAEADAQPRWRTEILNFHEAFRSFATRSMRQLVDLDELWTDAVEGADTRLLKYGSKLPKGLPSACPIGFEELLAKEVDWDALVKRIVARHRASPS